MNVESTSLSSSLSAEAVDRLEQSIKFMITTLLEDGLIQKGDIVDMLEDIIQTIKDTRS